MKGICDLDKEGRLVSQSLTMAQISIENVSKRPFKFLLGKAYIFNFCNKTF